MSRRARMRGYVVAALDSLVNVNEWTGNVQEVWLEMRRQGNHGVSDYMIRQVLNDYGESTRRGQYRVTRGALRGVAVDALGAEERP